MHFNRKLFIGAAILAICVLSMPAAIAAPVPGGTLDPLTIPKYVTPLVIPPVMNDTNPGNDIQDNDYNIAVRQFKQQILPGGIWNTVNGRADAFLPTTVWSYGPDADPLPDSEALGGGAGIAPAANSQFNYPAYTVENTKDVTTNVNWINDLVANPWPTAPGVGGCGNPDPALGDCVSIPHILPIDQTLHWANPKGTGCLQGEANRTDCRTGNQDPYMGPVPIIVHVHGSHVVPESDGYPEAWWLPDAANVDCDGSTLDTADDYVCQGTLANGYDNTPNTNVTQQGVANFTYANDQPTLTAWYHDHTLGMTRNNVYAGPAGFWLLREGDGGETGLGASILPGPAPAPGEGLAVTNLTQAQTEALGLGPIGEREKYREIPIVIQDRSFNDDGSLFYPANRAFFEGLGTGQVPSTAGNIGAGLDIPFIGDETLPSDIAPIWNPEAFFNTMVVNGVSWPVQEVAPAQYRFRLLNGCNSRFLNLAMFEVNPGGQLITSRELPFFQIGTEQSLMPQVVMVQTGFATTLAQGDPIPAKKKDMTPAAHKDQALLMGLAERADTLVDFSGLPNGTRIRMVNTAPDAPFGGFPDVAADPRTTGQVMEFVVNTALLGKSPTDPVDSLGNPNLNAATAPNLLALGDVDGVTGYPMNAGGVDAIQDLALLEEESAAVCVSVSPNGSITYIDLGGLTFDPLDPANICFAAGGVPFAPMAAVLGTQGSLGGTVQLWSDPITTNPASGSIEEWELWNWSADAHPIHLHLVKFKVTGRSGVIAGTPSLVPGNGVQPWENGWKDTVIAYPGEVTKVAATFDIDGLYVWHCHIVEHEDNEMMVPYCVGAQDANGCQNLEFDLIPAPL